MEVLDHLVTFRNIHKESIKIVFSVMILLKIIIERIYTRIPNMK